MNKSMIFLSLMLVLCSYSAIAQCTEQWDCTAWGSCNQGISERMCFDLNGCGTVLEMPAESAACRDVLKYCYDEVINQDESDIDCGGIICDKCGIGDACFRNDDCSEGNCISGKCSYEESPAPALNVNYYSILLWVTGIILVIAIISVLFHLIKGVSKRLRKSEQGARRRTNFQWPFWKLFSKRLKKQKIIVLSDERESVKEEIKIISKKSMDSGKKKTRFNRFADNLSGYLKSMKSESGSKIKEKPQKGLLNKNPSKIQAHPAKEFVLSNLKEVYNDE